ncbi:MAG: 3-deoxy-D-manno-octulosonic acid transferase [Blastocatellia bacterium]|nr:3-deoxy-D-manno-octulosonic acid transferase [Blastocatellia bacterium]
MYFFYSLALTLLFLALLPYFIYQAVRHGKYAGSFKQRLGRLPASFGSDSRPTIWVHAVSVGEFNAARPLIESLRREMPSRRLVVSTTTLTGQQLAQAQVPDAFDAAFYFPFDWAFAVRRALDQVNPEAVIILETELWPNFLRECRRRGVMTAVVNGRFSPRSFARYLKWRRFTSRMLADVSLLIMQSEADGERARQLGAPVGNVRVCGNLKYDVRDNESALLDSESADGLRASNLQEELDRQFALSDSPRLIVAGSTAPGEEKISLAALHEARACSGLEDARLILAPRHPERFDEVAALIEQSGFSFARRSEAVSLSAAHGGAVEGSEWAASRGTDVILLDTIGELASVYRFAAVVFVGGSLVPRGGHNIIEPAVYAKPIIVGPHTENFRQIVSDFASRHALVQSETVESFAREVIRLLSDRKSAEEMGARAQAILLENRGATPCIIAAIRERMS